MAHSIILIRTKAGCVEQAIRGDASLNTFTKQPRLDAVESLLSDAEALHAVLEEENEAGHEALHDTQDLLTSTCADYSTFSQSAIEAAGLACRNATP